jgi:hypothetical protein
MSSPPPRSPAAAASVCLAALLALVPAVVPAQTVSFGKNKIQYKEFQWRVLHSEHFQLYYYPEEEELARTALGMAEEAYDVVAARMRHEVDRLIPLIIYSSHQDFEQTNVSPYFLPEGVAGFTEFLKGRVAMPFNGSYRDFQHTLQHELVHVFQISRLDQSYRLHYRNDFIGPPLWFTEGMAEHWSEEWNSTGDLFLRDLVLEDNLPAIRDLWRLNGTFILYKVGQDLIGFLEREYGSDVVPAIYEELWRSDSFEDALESVTGVEIAELNLRWHHGLDRRYFPHVERSRPVELAAEPLAVSGPNFKPAIAPPGSPVSRERLYFLSPRTGYTNIYSASVHGREKDVEKIVKGQRQPEFESFHPFQSKLDLSVEGKLAFVSKFYERDGLFLYDLRSETLDGQWQFEGLVALRSPTFSPDGREVVFAALSESGRQDLYRFDLDTETLRRLTSDFYWDDDPEWSPDGRTLAFVSDRTPWGMAGSTNIFLLDLETGELTPRTFGPWSDRSPAFDDDGARIVFSSDRDGTPQLYVADSTGTVRITSLLGGASDPVWLPGGDHVVFTAMSKLRFGIYRTAAEPTGERARADFVASLVPGVDPGRPVSADRPAWVLTSPVALDSLGARDLPYRRRYTLDFAQGGVAFEPTQNAGEGLQALLSDQLGDRLIFLQASNTAQEFSDILGRMSFGATYWDLSQRFNRGVSAFHFAGDFVDELGFTYFERRTGASVLASYPYSRYFRVESSLGLLHSSREADSFRPSREGLLAANYLSFIHDTSLWSSTGPIDGSRYNLSLGLTTNLERVELENIAALVDLRHYFRTGLRTAYAVRFQGRLSEGSLPQRFVLGGSWSLRGYPRRSLVGTRSLLLNQEWRFPLLYGAALGLPIGTLGLPPVEAAVFLDAASAWEEGEDRSGVDGSFGLGLRTNLAGFLVLRLDFARRTDFTSIEPKTEVDFFVGFNY